LKKTLFLIPAALYLGFLAGRYGAPQKVTAAAPAEQPVRELVFADSEVRKKTFSSAVNTDILPDDLYVRLKNEAEAKESPEQTQKPPAEEKTIKPELSVREDNASKAHREASAGVKALERGNCSLASEHLQRAFTLKNDKDILSNYAASLVICGEAEKAADAVSGNILSTDGARLGDIIETAVKKGRHTDALIFFETLNIKENGRLMNAAGLAYEAAGNMEKALISYKKAYLLEPENPFISFSRARAADMEGDYAQAVILYEKTASTASDTNLKRYSVSRSAEIREHLTGGSLQMP
jgi:tetratricopeptide (TPR) repeat protein